MAWPLSWSRSGRGRRARRFSISIRRASCRFIVEDGGGAVSGIEAIGEYLEETRAGKATLIPGDGRERAEVRRLTGWFDTKFYAEVSEPIITEKIIRRFMTRETGGGAPDMARVRYGLSRLRDHLDYIGHAGRPPLVAGGRGAFASPILRRRRISRSSTISAIFRGRIFRWPSAGTSGSSRGRHSGRCSATRCAACRRLPPMPTSISERAARLSSARRKASAASGLPRPMPMPRAGGTTAQLHRAELSRRHGLACRQRRSAARRPRPCGRRRRSAIVLAMNYGQELDAA